MFSLLAYADSSDPNAMNLPIMLVGVAFLVVACILAFVLMFIARARGHRQAELITTLAVFWGLLAAASLAYAGMSRLHWANQYNLDLQSGYGNPQDTGDRPPLPWKTWGTLTVAYGVLIGWSVSEHNPPRREN